MTQTPAGWYPDPDPDAGPGSSRFWDGRAWTDRVRAEGPPPASPWPDPPVAPHQQGDGQQEPAGQPQGQAPSYGAGPDQPYGYGQAPAYGYAQPHGHDPVGGQPVTPDRQPLAGWGRRGVAYILDSLVVGVLAVLLGWSFWSQVLDGYGRLLDASMEAARSGAPAPDQMAILEDINGPLLAGSLIALALNLVYFGGFWAWRGATPAMSLLGMRLRAWEGDGPLGNGRTLRRWLGLNLGSVVSLLPVIGCLGAPWPFADLLSPPWDRRRQALHDKFAGTVVVRTR